MDFLKNIYLPCAIFVIIAVLQLTESSLEESLNEPSLYKTSNSSSYTFQVCDKIPEKVNTSIITEVQSEHLASTLYAYRQNGCVRVIQGTDFSRSAGLFQASGNNGFINTAIQCYNSHHNLVIRPDDIWTAIITQFSLYINGNAERFRKLFVNFNGRRDLIVYLGDGTLDSVSYIKFVKIMEQVIDKNIINTEIRNFIMPNFTTTTQDDKIAAGVIFMSTLKKYFRYGAFITCGIPKVTLEGTVDDWKNIKQRLIGLKSYDLKKWVDEMLTPILDQFVRAKQGDVDREFWSSIVNVNDKICGDIYVSGWITAFNVFDREGAWIGRTWEGDSWPTVGARFIVSGVSEATVTVNDNGKIHETVMFAGHMAKEILPDGYTLKPKIGWVIALKNTTSAESEGFDWSKWSNWFK